MYCKTNLISSVLVSAGLFGAGAVRAEFVVVDDFESYGTPEDIGLSTATTDWYAPDFFFVVDDPADPGNNVLLINSGTDYGSLNLPVEIGLNDTGTLYQRVRIDDIAAANVNFGLSDINFTGDSFASSDFEAQINISNGTINVRDGGGFASVVQTASFENEVWYDFWIVANNATDEYSVYVAGGSFTTPTKLEVTYDGGVTTDDTFVFRNSISGGSIVLQENLLQSTITRASGANSTYLDDFYIDPAGENLTVPVPEPGMTSLAGVGALLMVRRRRESGRA